jgi:D-amino peptidase
MKIYISSDMEGTAGVVDWSQCVAGGPDYNYYRGLLQDEVNASITGAMAAGGKEFLVNDSHSIMQNLYPDKLEGRARYLSGRYKPMYMMEGLDSSYDAIFFVSYHGSMSSNAAILSHTYNPRAIADIKLNGEFVSEAGLNALVAQAFGVPIALVTGDDTTAVETEMWAPGVLSAVVKKSVTRLSADNMHPVDACQLIKAKAEEAVKNLKKMSPPKIALPATIEIKFHNSDFADIATWLPGTIKTSTKVVELTDSDPLQLFRRFITTVILTRTFVEWS